MKFSADGSEPADAPVKGALNTDDSDIPAQPGNIATLENVVQMTPFDLAAASCESGMCKMFIGLESINGASNNRLVVGEGLHETGSDLTMESDTRSSRQRLFAYANDNGADVFLQAFLDTDLPIKFVASIDDSSIGSSFYFTTNGKYVPLGGQEGRACITHMNSPCQDPHARFDAARDRV